MNLAEIRRKAQRSEAPAEASAAPESPPAVPVGAPEPVTEDAAPESEPAAPPSRSLRPMGLVPAEDWDDEPQKFDPTGVILKGRETALTGTETAAAEELGTEALELLCFRVAHEEYALSIMDIKEIIKPREVTEVPRVPSFVRGVLSLRGIIIPIFDMRVRLGLPDAATSEKERVVVVKRETGFSGILVDEVVQVVRIPEGGIEPPPVVLEGIDRDFVKGIGRVGGRMLILLDMEKVLDVTLF